MQALLWGIPNTHVNALCLRTAFTTLQPDPARERSHESQNRRSFGFAVSQALLALACCVQDAGKIGSGIAKFDGSE
jgi:hypothetical protein